jgi:hypothetical protein
MLALCVAIVDLKVMRRVAAITRQIRHQPTLSCVTTTAVPISVVRCASSSSSSSESKVPKLWYFDRRGMLSCTNTD